MAMDLLREESIGRLINDLMTEGDDAWSKAKRARAIWVIRCLGKKAVPMLEKALRETINNTRRLTITFVLERLSSPVEVDATERPC